MSEHQTTKPTGLPSEEQVNFWQEAQIFVDSVVDRKIVEAKFTEFCNQKNFNYNEVLLLQELVSEAFKMPLVFSRAKGFSNTNG